MADFIKAYLNTCIIEGKYDNDPDDPGGETWKGISRKKDPNWSGWAIIDKYKEHEDFPEVLNHISKLEISVQEHFKKEYWDIHLLDNIINESIALEIYDTGVNCGVKTIAGFVQECLNVSNRRGRDYGDIQVDRIIGSETVRLINNHPRPKELLKALNCLQGSRYITLCLQDDKFEKYYVGWMTRVYDI